MHSLDLFDTTTRENIAAWLDGPYGEETKNEIKRLLTENPKELEDCFFQRLSFGTGGIRALMGVGTNRLNPFTIQFATQGVANYLKKIYPSPKDRSLKVLIGYDNRNNSSLFATECARVLAGNGIKAFLFEELRPTPLISFGCRLLGCQGAIMITASHNPPAYNGFKVYGSDGGQVLPPYDQKIIDEVALVRSPTDVKIASFDHPLIEKILAKLDRAYLDHLFSLNHWERQNKKEGKQLKIIYTNLHGTGLTLLPQALSDWGFTSISYVEDQKSFDGNFPNARVPNPEEPEALKEGIQLLMHKKADILLATDPDADRIAAVILHQEKPIILSGNELASLLLYHICSSLKEKQQLPANGAVVKSIVTSELFNAIATGFGMNCFDVLTGFKYISQLVEQWSQTQEYTFVLGAEESYGYLAHTFARDKDAISTGCLIAEMALRAKLENKTLFDLLLQLYAEYGIYQESVFSAIYPEGKEGMKQMDKIMTALRKNPPRLFGNAELLFLEDYLESCAFDLISKKTISLSLPKSNVLRFWLDDNSKIVIRPSGTEPKIKIYVGVVEKNVFHIQEQIKMCKERTQALLQSVKSFLFKS